jgi:hypothetical protein
MMKFTVILTSLLFLLFSSLSLAEAVAPMNHNNLTEEVVSSEHLEDMRAHSVCETDVGTNQCVTSFSHCQSGICMFMHNENKHPLAIENSQLSFPYSFKISTAISKPLLTPPISA